ncbi:ABC transporter substrate-binding protein [Fusobacterium perfoetens]|uniref:ABC transporter substrate-binding protein n=1 Tax=Fusobacterium perfoetens TaxID=852 RepID=UPI000487510F|nr:ABC transporter substrate-binding protein [Fusobacterium perfoetens]MCI6151886.1 ABC transporter substrate-binding protein [Fusobacterium perfoetens]MDY3238226.1 ABC transporter substrate-binding protein [Fusobacterium perfoetens]
MKKIKYLLLFLLVFSFGFGKEKKLQDFDVILDWYPNAIHSFLYIADEKGYFEEEGINLVIHYPANVSDPIALPAVKKAHVGMYYLHQLIMARANENIPVKSIGAIVQKPLNVVIAPESKNIKRPKDLEGKTVGYSQGYVAERLLQTVIKNDGGDLSKTNLIDVGFDLLTATITKKVDATFGGFVNHEVPVFQDKGLEVNYFYPTDFGFPNYYEEVFVANEDMVKANPELYKGFLRAIARGFEEMKNDPEGAIDLLLQKQEADQFPLTKTVEMKSINILLPLMETKENKFLSQDKKVWEENIQWMYNEKMINKEITSEDVMIEL